MLEYIEREAAITAIRGRCDPCGEGIEALKSVPVVDVAPVRHGWWITKQEKDTFAGYLYSYECSECGRVGKCKEPYCNCGARMDGGADNG